MELWAIGRAQMSGLLHTKPFPAHFHGERALPPEWDYSLTVLWNPLLAGNACLRATTH